MPTEIEKTNPAAGETRGRVACFDALRLMAAFAVALLHTADPYARSCPMGSAAWNAGLFYDGLTRWSVAVFVMISGALFLDPARPVETKSFIRRRVGRLLRIYLFWSALYALLSTFLLKKDNSLFLLLVRFVSGHFHLWFLLMLMGMYLLVPLLRRLTERQEDARYFLLLSLVFTFLIPTVSALLRYAGETVFRSELIAGAGDVFTRKVRLYFTLGFTPFFIGGHVLYRAKITPRQEKLVYLLGILGAAVNLAVLFHTSRRSGVLQEQFFEQEILGVTAQSAAVFVFAKQRLGKRGGALLRAAGEACLGAYLLHVLVLEALDALRIPFFSAVPWVGIPVKGALVFGLSLGLAVLLRKLPGARKLM